MREEAVDVDEDLIQHLILEACVVRKKSDEEDDNVRKKIRSGAYWT